MAKLPKPCIFCEQYGDKSKEHVLARWLEEIFKRDPRDTHTFGVADDIRAFRPAQDTGFRTINRQGRTHTLRARVVCEDCNSGWLGDNQTRTKPILQRLIMGEIFDFRPQDQAHLAFWAVRAGIVSEFLSGNIIVNVSQEARSVLMHDLKPPLGWFVWVGGYGGARPITGHEFISGESGTLVATSDDGSNVPFYMHGVTIGLGRLIIYVVGTNFPEQDFVVTSDVLLRIWPPPSDTVLWPPALLINDQQEANISRGLLQTFPLRLPDGWTF